MPGHAPNDDLDDFRTAQAAVRASVTSELTAGKKRSHWMWFVFPQLAGLGRSSMAQHYAIRDLRHARRYLVDPVLGTHLREDVQLILTLNDVSAHDIFGSPDDMKLRSCLTLFEAASESATDRALFSKALDRFYQGERDPLTLSLLKAAPQG